MRGLHSHQDLTPFEVYIQKTYCKTGALIANSCKAAAILGSQDPQVHRLAFDFGKHLGVAFQLVDDALDFEVSAALLGKPAMANMKLGIATAPVLFAQREFPELRKLVERKFSAPGDIEEAHLRVVQSNGLALTRKLALAHASTALDTLQKLVQSPARDSLFQICQLVCTRQK
eukprot:INCI14646.1.p2 GENE.INCI14646.1~~INCI14646.1.p2  ORF type:complete len:173 (-),score=29.76 INCI14646.1:104-622(-)